MLAFPHQFIEQHYSFAHKAQEGAFPALIIPGKTE